MNLKEKLYTHWENQKTCVLNLGLNPNIIKNFEDENNIFLPKNYTDYLESFNGFSNTDLINDWSVTDDEGFEFYPLEKKYLLSEKYLIFSAWSIGLLKYAICVDKSENNGHIIRIIDKSRGYYLAKDFDEFISLYLSDAESLYVPGSVVVSLV